MASSICLQETRLVRRAEKVSAAKENHGTVGRETQLAAPLALGPAERRIPVKIELRGAHNLRSKTGRFPDSARSNSPAL